LVTYFEKNLSKEILWYLSDVLKVCESYRGNIAKTLKIVSSAFMDHNIDFIVFKTIAPFYYVSTDVDILVKRRDFEKACALLKQIYPREEFERMHNSISAGGRSDLVPVDLHYEVSWFGTKSISEESIWERKNSTKFMGVEVSIPSKEDEILILMAHSIFQHHYTILGEFYFITELMNNINMEYILKQAIRYHWKSSFQELFAALLLRHDFLHDTDYFARYNVPRRYHCSFDLGPIYFHPLRLIPMKNLVHIQDLILTIFRRLRFKVNKELPYNTNWLRRVTKLR